jgi:hypothetical protein
VAAAGGDTAGPVARLPGCPVALVVRCACVSLGCRPARSGVDQGFVPWVLQLEELGHDRRVDRCYGSTDTDTATDHVTDTDTDTDHVTDPSAVCVACCGVRRGLCRRSGGLVVKSDPPSRAVARTGAFTGAPMTACVRALPRVLSKARSVIVSRVTSRRSDVDAVDGDGDEYESFDRLFERRRSWTAAPDDVQHAVIIALVDGALARAARSRRLASIPAAVVAVSVVAGFAAGHIDALWAVYGVSMAVWLWRQTLTAWAAYPPVGDLFERCFWFGAVDRTFRRRLDEDGSMSAGLVPAARVGVDYAAALAAVDAVGDLPGATAASDPWRSLLCPFIERQAPGLSAAVCALATTARFQHRPLRDAISATQRAYTRVDATVAATER